MAADDDIPPEDPVQFRVRFSSYVDQSIYELGLEPFYSSGDGNCFYNSLSILMSGHESDNEFFRLGAAMYGLAHYNHIVDAVRTISYLLLCLLSVLVYNFNVLVSCFKSYFVLLSYFFLQNAWNFSDRGNAL
ncbi:unnamed protein product [Pocillopora meandrina]|uniref:OTU domain-containing protein n=1 Tax=Pocillopora meandrina TaxID=46732 RepID=A0AAU9XU93_9CNID|nr:unnamed protein product [Pocillopora meandrina]